VAIDHSSRVPYEHARVPRSRANHPIRRQRARSASKGERAAAPDCCLFHVSYFVEVAHYQLRQRIEDRLSIGARGLDCQRRTLYRG
jgi:hypothetical protein